MNAEIDLTGHVKALREHLQQTQIQFAQTLGVGPSNIQRYERETPTLGEAALTLSKLAAVAREAQRDDLAESLEAPIRALLTTPPPAPDPASIQLARRLERLRHRATPKDWDHLMGMLALTEKLYA